MIKRVLVTGGAGFIGSHVVEALLQKEMEVVVLDNLNSGKLEHLNLSHPNLEFVEGDILEFPLVEKLLEHCDAVYHAAAIASVPQSFDEPIYTFQVNVQGFLHVLNAIERKKRPIKLVYVSSAAVYGNTNGEPSRDDVDNHAIIESHYALHKKQDEQFAALYDRLYNLKSVGLRYFNVYGPRQDPASAYSGVISRFIDAYHSDEPLKIFGDGLQSRDFIFVDDVVAATLLALESDLTGVFNIATGRPETLLQLIDCIEKAGGHPAKKTFLPVRIGDVARSLADVSLAETILGFRAKTPLQEGIATLVTSKVK